MQLYIYFLWTRYKFHNFAVLNYKLVQRIEGPKISVEFANGLNRTKRVELGVGAFFGKLKNRHSFYNTKTIESVEISYYFLG